MQSFPEPRVTTNPYLVMLRDSLAANEEMEIRVFSWRDALLRRFNVFHVHWPELLLTGTSPRRSLAKQLLMLVLLIKVTLLRTPVVRTLHNTGRHEGLSGLQHALLDLLDRRTTSMIVLNESPVSTSCPSTVILHGHYRDWFARYRRSAVHPGQLSFFGILRTYKGLDRLLEVFRQTPGDLRLRMAGRAYPPELGDQLTKLAELDERVELTCEYVDDQELVEIATEAELVVLPYREMHNSGSVLAALSLDRPVLVPWNEVTERLQREVGAEWVITYEDDLSSDVLLAALASARRRSRTAVPDLSRRDWDLAGRQHLEVYRRALDLR